MGTDLVEESLLSLGEHEVFVATMLRDLVWELRSQGLIDQSIEDCYGAEFQNEVFRMMPEVL